MNLVYALNDVLKTVGILHDMIPNDNVDRDVLQSLTREVYAEIEKILQLVRG